LEGEPVTRIVVGIDGSEPANAALGWAIDMARRLQAEVIAVHALQTPTQLVAPYDMVAPVEYLTNWTEQFRREIKENLETTWSAPLAASGLSYRTVLEEGRPASVIAAVADRENADLVVVGRRGLGGVAELVIGSVSHELTHHSHRPLVIVPEPPRPSE
jgi:nucleotide-binding universal stress UspA family protein